MNLYQTLGVDPTASPEEIKKAYRRLAMRHHPDRNGSSDAMAKMQEIQRAYDVLGDPERRKRYDETGATEDGPNPVIIAKEQLAMLFVKLTQTQDADSYDFKKGARESVNAMIRDMKSKVDDLLRNLRNTEKARKRLKRKTEGEPFLIQVLDGHARQTKENITRQEGNIEIANLMLTMLDDYEYEVEKHQDNRQSIAEMIARNGSSPFFTWHP